MSIAGFPTSSDIYLEVDGVKVAVVQSYSDESIRDGIDFYGLSGFSLVICKPDRKIIYSDCQWSSISEAGTLGAMVVEKVTIVASKRIETGV